MKRSELKQIIKEVIEEGLIQEGTMSKKPKILGKTKSGKDVWNFYSSQKDFDDFSLEDHKDAIKIFDDEMQKYPKVQQDYWTYKAIRRTWGYHHDARRELDGSEEKDRNERSSYGSIKNLDISIRSLANS